MPQPKFLEKLESNSFAEIELVDGIWFQYKRPYDFWDKDSLRKFILEQGHEGIKEDEKLKQRMYKGVMKDIEELIQETFIRVVEVPESTRGQANQP